MSERTRTRLVSLLETLEAGPWQPATGWRDETIVRNCELLIAAGLARKSLPLAAVAVQLLADRQPDTVRGVMYATVSCGWLPDTSPKSYAAVQRILNVLRKKRVIPFAWVVDNIRATDKPSSWAGLEDFAETVADAYRRDFWQGLEDYVCVIVEKDTVAGRIAPVTRKYDIALHSLRGFSSTSFAYGIAEQWRQIEKPIHVYYIGDHDPSGRKIEDSIRERLAEYSGKEVSWQRLAVEPADFERFKIIPLEPKKRDTRYRQFAQRYGTKCAEVEAIPADALRDMVCRAIESHIPTGAWARLQEVEAQEKSTWSTWLGKLKPAGGVE